MYRFEVTAFVAGTVPIRLRYWSVREALSVEKAFHNLGYQTVINPMVTRRSDEG